jgi:hypothetical protein
MKSSLELTLYFLNGLALKGVINAVFFATKISSFLKGGKANITTRIVGVVRVNGPRIFVLKVINAIEKLKEEDEELYGRLIEGKPLLIFCGSDLNALALEHGAFILAIRFMASLEALVSLFVFWCIFQKGASVQNLANKGKRTVRIREATHASVEWMEARRYSKELVEWVRIGGLQKDGLPPKVSK